MPWDVKRDSRCPKSKPFGLIKRDDNKLMGCHASTKHAHAQRAALHVAEGKEMDEEKQTIAEQESDDCQQKDIGEPKYIPTYGATSFAEWHKARAADEAVQEITDMADVFRRMIDNIMYNQDIDNKPAAIKALADEYAALVGETMDEAETKDQADNEAIIRKAVDEGTHEHAARVRDPDDFIPGSFRSKPLPASKGGKGGVRMIIGKLKGGTGSTTVQAYRFPANLYTVAEAKKWLKDNDVKYTSFRQATAGKKEQFGLLEHIGEALKSWFAEEVPPPMPVPFMVWKQADGRYRWLATYSNKYRDRDQPPEILSEAAHVEFVKAAEAGEWPYPELWLWHVDGTCCGVADWLTYADGFAVASGTIDKAHAGVAERLDNYSEPLAVSHGMPAKEIVRDVDDPTVITRYRTREISVLPAWAAANALTGFDIQEVKEMAIPEDKKAFLLAAGLTEESIAAIEADLEGKAKEAADAGLEFKQTDKQPPGDERKDEAAPVETPADEVPPAPAPEPALTAEDIAAAVREVLAPLEARLAELETLKEKVEALNKAEDERIDEKLALTPAASLADLIRGAMGTTSAVGSEEARIDGRKALAKAGPKETEAPDDAPQLVGIPWVNQMLTATRQ